MGNSHGEPSRRVIRSENHNRPGQNGATNSRRPLSRRTLGRRAGAERSGKKLYRLSLGQGTEQVQNQGIQPQREPERTVRSQQSRIATGSPEPGQKSLHICFTT